MPRLDRALLERSTFPHRCDVATRFADLDQIGHVNNVAMAAILQEARYQFFLKWNVITGTQPQLVVAALTIEYADDIFHPHPVDISTGVLEIGRTSFRLVQVARQQGRVSTFSETVQVTRNERGPVPIPDEWRRKLETAKLV
jgi:acyl-CoA thioester hydrolase